METIPLLSGSSSLCKQRECLQGLNTISIQSPIRCVFLHPEYFPPFFYYSTRYFPVEWGRNRSSSLTFFFGFLCFCSIVTKNLGQFIALINSFTPKNIFIYMQPVFSFKFIPHHFNGIYVRWLHLVKHQFKDLLFLFAFDVPLAEFTSVFFGYYLVIIIQILEPQAAFQIKSRDATLLW